MSSVLCLHEIYGGFADLATYDKVKHWLLAQTSLKDNAVTHAISSAGAGFAAAIVSTPADVVKTRIMNQPYDKAGRYNIKPFFVRLLITKVSCNIKF